MSGFLLHGRVIDHIGIATYAVGSVPVMLVHIAVSVAAIYLLSWVVYQVYHVCTAWLFKHLDRFCLPEPELTDSEYT